MEKKCLNTKETSERIGLSLTKTQQYIRAGVIPSISLGRRYLVPVDALDRWLNEQAMKKASQA